MNINFTMDFRNESIKTYLSTFFIIYGILGRAQHVKNAPEAFASIHSEPKVIRIDNTFDIPSDGGHFQGVQLIVVAGVEKILISGSSSQKAYVLQVDMAKRKADKLITLMNAPYRHVGGIQISTPYLIAGIEDNFVKTISKVCLYNYLDANLYKANPNMVINRQGKAKRQTAGATGLLALKNQYLAVVADWDSRNWDFYQMNPEKSEWHLIKSFSAPDNWPNYQSINLLRDDNAIYAIGFYQEEAIGQADLILVSELVQFKPILKQIAAKKFRCMAGVDFSSAAGIQIDHDGQLSVLATQREAGAEIVLNRFSQK